MRALDWWINGNLVTLLVTVISIVRCWGWHQDNRRVLSRLGGREAALCRLNLTVARWFIGINAAVFCLGLYLIQVARGIDRAASAAHPARVPAYVVQGTMVFAGIWVAVSVGVWWFSRSMERILYMVPGATLHAMPKRDERAMEGGD